MARRLVVIQAAALAKGLPCGGLRFSPLESVFPALTCTVQASFRTALPPAGHGMIANGVYLRPLRRPMFWEQSSALVSGERIWEGFRRRGGTVGLMFWQQSLGERADLLLSPAPIHKHHGGMIQDCYGRPYDLYARLCSAVGRPFKLQHYWGPLASAKSGDWIAQAVAAVLADKSLAPDLLLVYLPTLDYDLQRFGPDHAKAERAHQALAAQVEIIRQAAGRSGHEILIFGDYAIAPVRQAAFPNLALAEAGMLKLRPVGDMLYPDFHASDAFAMVDHQAAHVYVREGVAPSAVAKVLAGVDGVAEVLDRSAQQKVGLDHANSGELVLLAQEGAWFAYPWWRQARQAPDYARHIDIHNKPGYDPCELFFGWPPMSVSQDTGRIHGSHGRSGPTRRGVWAASFGLEIGRGDAPDGCPSVVQLAGAVKAWLESS